MHDEGIARRTFLERAGLAAFSAAGPATGDTQDCRMYQLVTALKSAAERDARCPLVGAISSACR